MKGQGKFGWNKLAGEVEQGGGCGDRVILAQRAGEQRISPLFLAVRQGGVIDYHHQHYFACHWSWSCRLSLKTKEPLMRVWNRKIRAENVLVGGGGIELASAERLSGEGALYHNQCNHCCLSRLCDSGHGTLGSMPTSPSPIPTPTTPYVRRF